MALCARGFGAQGTPARSFAEVVLEDESSLRVSEEEEEEPTIFGGDDFELHLLMYQQS